MSGPVRVAIADDHPVVRDGIALLLELTPDVEVVGVAASGDEIIALADRHALDVILMDLRMPRLGGVEAIRRIRAAHPGTRIVVLTTYADDAEIVAAFEAGAVGYLTKDAERREIQRAVTAAADGESPVSPRIRDRLARQAERTEPDGPKLTPRELEVLKLIAAGKSNPEIMALLHISEPTTKTHINRIFTKTGARHRAEVVRYAYEHGLAG